jgi:glycosyltransferase involved in cell wall biosynthesis
MNILICTQSVDSKDPVAGFFYRWVVEFSKHCETVFVVALSGDLSDPLPPNVRLFSLGKRGAAHDPAFSILKRLSAIVSFWKSIWRERKGYDAVFVHNVGPIVVLLGWPLWRLARKKIALWYTHGSVPLTLRLAEKLSDVVFTASEKSFRLSSRKLHVVGHGIDTEFFAPDPTVPRGTHFLSVGHLRPRKRHDLALRAAKDAGVMLRIAGSGPDREKLEREARAIGVEAEFLGGRTQGELREEYRRAARCIHRSETGSLDKVVLEAAACGCPVDTNDPALAALPLSPRYVHEHHSLQQLIPRIVKELCT